MIERGLAAKQANIILKLEINIGFQIKINNFQLPEKSTRMEAKLFNNKSLVYLNRNHLLLYIENYYIGLKSIHRLK